MHGDGQIVYPGSKTICISQYIKFWKRPFFFRAYKRAITRNHRVQPLRKSLRREVLKREK